MKKLFTSAVLFLCCVATSFAQFSGSGSGTESDPYLILNPVQLNQMRNFLNQTNVYFKLMEDIDLKEFIEDEYPSQGWFPIGSASAPFRGFLDGNNHVISGLWISRENSGDVGFFGNTSSCTIKNLTISADKIEGKDGVGVIFGSSSRSLISRCTVSGKVNGFNGVGGCVGSGDAVTLQEVKSMVEITGNNQVGGLIGCARGNGVSSSSSPTIYGCKIVSQNIKGNDYIGGLCGSYNGTIAKIDSCFVNANICGNNYVGGITGQVQNEGKYNSHGYSCNIIRCGYSGDISGNSYVGGISGEHSSQTTLDKCFAIARINAIGNYVGGIVGYSNGTYNQVYETLSNSYFSGSIIGGRYTSGIVGYKYQGRIVNCYSNASVAGTECVGGIFGYAEGYNNDHNFKSTANIANLTAIKASKGKIGRIYGEKGYSAFVGEIGTAAENKAFNKAIVINAGVAQDVNDNEQNGTSVSATTLKLKATYVAMGWDFNDTWEIQERECYPYFKTQTAPPVITSQVVSGATTISGKCIDGGLITLEIDGVTQQMISTGNNFSFNVSPLQAGHEVRVSAKADGKEQSYFTTEVVSFLGKGTEADPYQISTAADLTQVYRKGYYKLMNDIDLTSYINQFSPTEGWQSIGRDGSETIHFDGDGHKVTGLWCNSTRDNTGLFSCFANGNIKDLTVETAAGKQVKGGANTGILIGKMINGTIEKCKVTGAVADGTPVGGMVGLFDGGEILKCQASVTINTTASTTYAGGLVGEITGGEIDQCYTDGSLTATGDESYAGGLVGKNSGTITNCYSSAVVTSSYNAAGLVAYNFGVVDKCMVSGNLYSNNYAAGVIGYNDGAAAVISNSVALNNIIDVTYESQQIQQGGGYGQRIIGGIKNGAPAPEMNNYALSTMQVSVNDVPQIVYNDIMNGTAKTDAELKQKATYQTLGWDFDNIWKIDEGTSYPYQTIQVNSGSDPNDPNNPNLPTDIEVTDVSQIDNVIYMEEAEVRAGTQATISLKMKNTKDIRGFQFDLYLPEGVTAVKSAKGKIQGALSAGRLPEEDEHTLTLSEQEDGAIRFLCSSQYEETFTGTDGEIVTLQVNIADNMEDGDYAIRLKDVKLTENDISKFYLTDLVNQKLTVITYITGDISGDGIVDVSDYTGVANYIHGKTPTGFNAKAADVNADNTIDVLDYTGIANIIHTGSVHGTNHAMMVLSSNNSPLEVTDVSNINNVIYITPFSAAAGSEEYSVSIKMKNTADIRGFQFDLYLPEGVTAVKSAKGKIQGALSVERLPEEDEHTLTLSEQSNGAIRFLCSSQYEETFTGTDGEIATLKVNVASDIPAGEYAVVLKDVKLTENDISVYYLTEQVNTIMTVTAATDGRILLDETSTDVPEAATNANVRVKRTILANEWSTICLPFAMTESQVKTAFGNDVQLAEFVKYEVTNNGKSINVVFDNVNLTADGLKANYPYIIMTSSNIEEFTVDGVTIDPDEDNAKAEYDNGQTGGSKEIYGTFKGTYHAGTTVPNNCLFLSGNNFWYSTGSTNMKAFRGYFDFVDVLSDIANARIGMSFDDEPTDVKHVTFNIKQNTGEWYTLDGRKLDKKPTAKGVYVNDGRKVVIK